MYYYYCEKCNRYVNVYTRKVHEKTKLHNKENYPLTKTQCKKIGVPYSIKYDRFLSSKFI